MSRCRDKSTTTRRIAWSGSEHEVALCDFHAAGLAATALTAPVRSIPEPAERSVDDPECGHTWAMQTLTLEGLSAPRLARQAVAQRCREANTGPECAAIAAVATSEVVTNGVLYGGGQVRLGVSADPVRVRVEVGDDSRRQPRIPLASDSAENGRGLLLVDTMCSAWGVLNTPGGKIVWFEVPAQP